MLQLSQKVTVYGIDKYMFCRHGKIVAIWAVCMDFVPSGERKDFFCYDVIMILQQRVRAARSPYTSSSSDTSLLVLSCPSSSARWTSSCRCSVSIK